MPSDHLRPREVEQVGIAGDVARMVAEPLAAVRLLPTHVALDEDAPRAVEHDDPPREKLLQLFDPVAHETIAPA